MAAILAKKLGMTQRFLEDGRVERVTVLEAGPCPVTAIRTMERDGYEAVQLAFGACKEKSLTKAELGHLKKADASAHRHVVEFRDQAGELLVGETVTVDAFEAGQRVKISGTSKGKGFQGTIRRHNFKSGPKSHGSHNVRAPGSIGASATPSRVFKGIRGPGRMGGGRVTQRGLTVVEVMPKQNLLLVRGAVPGPKGSTVEVRTDGWGASRAPKRGGGSATLDGAAFEARFNMPLVHETVRAELNARRQGTASTKTRGEVSGGGAKPWRQKGTGRARAGSSRSPVWTGGGVVFGPTPRHYTAKVNRKARRAALRSALSAHADRESVAVFDAAAFDEPSTKQAADLLLDWGATSPTLVLLSEDEAAAGKSFRNLKRVAVMPVGDAGVADVIGAASLLVSETAMTGLVARAGGAGEGEG